MKARIAGYALLLMAAQAIVASEKCNVKIPSMTPAVTPAPLPVEVTEPPVPEQTSVPKDDYEDGADVSEAAADPEVTEPAATTAAPEEPTAEEPIATTPAPEVPEVDVEEPVATTAAPEETDETEPEAPPAETTKKPVSGGSTSFTRASNPYEAVPTAKWYVDPKWSAKAAGEEGGENVSGISTAVWMDRIGALAPEDPDAFGLADHLDACVEQGCELFQVVVYDLPNRDCKALASNGELLIAEDGLKRYEEEYIAPLAATLGDPKYAGIHIIAIIEPDSLPNLVTNLDIPACEEANGPGGYVEGTTHTLNVLGEIPNVYSYIDIGHSGWLGWEDNFEKSTKFIGDVIKKTDKGVESIAGFVANTANTTPTEEPFLDELNGETAFPGDPSKQVRQATFYEWNMHFSEKTFVEAWYTKMVADGFPSTIGMLIDTSRNGWGGPDRPEAVSSSDDLDTFVDESRVDKRAHRGNWCNQDSGIGERPQVIGKNGIHAYVWVKPPGDSDGASSEELSYDETDPNKGFDRFCDPTYTTNAGFETGATANAPVAGRWYPEQLVSLIKKAYPPF